MAHGWSASPTGSSSCGDADINRPRGLPRRAASPGRPIGSIKALGTRWGSVLPEPRDARPLVCADDEEIDLGFCRELREVAIHAPPSRLDDERPDAWPWLLAGPLFQVAQKHLLELWTQMIERHWRGNADAVVLLGRPRDLRHKELAGADRAQLAGPVKRSLRGRRQLDAHHHAKRSRPPRSSSLAAAVAWCSPRWAVLSSATPRRSSRSDGNSETPSREGRSADP